MARVLCITIAMILLASAVGAQGLFVEQGRSAFFASGGLITGKDLSGGGFEFGFSGQGRVDFGVAAVKSKQTFERTFQVFHGEPLQFYTSTLEAWTSGIVLREYPIRSHSANGGELVVHLSQAITWVSPDIIPSGGSKQFFQLGGGLSLAIPTKSSLRVHLSGSFTRNIPTDDNIDGTSVFGADLTLQFPFRGGSFLVGPGIAHGNDLTTYGITVGVISLTKGRDGRL